MKLKIHILVLFPTQENPRNIQLSGHSRLIPVMTWRYDYAELFRKIWEIMKENGEDDFVEIDGDLSY